ncbi:MAG: hypothetical protein JW384_00276 [Nitrosomonadaceae bacterium]|nr:hypothetical protein [Nitrosomonadaceae bacterium]
MEVPLARLMVSSITVPGSAVPVNSGVVSLVMAGEVITGVLGAVVSITSFWVVGTEVNSPLASVAVAERL